MTEPYSNGSPSRPARIASKPAAWRKLHDDLSQFPLRAAPWEWPPLQARVGGTKMSRADDTDVFAPPWAQPGYRPPSPVTHAHHREPKKSQVDVLQRKLEEMSVHHRDSTDKITNIERIVTTYGSGPRFDDVCGPQVAMDFPAATGGGRSKVNQPREDDQGSCLRNKLPHRRDLKTFRDNSSVSSSSSSSSQESRARHKRLSKRRSSSPSKKRHTFRLSRFLPHNEWERPMTTERHWFYHGSLMSWVADCINMV